MAQASESNSSNLPLRDTSSFSSLGGDTTETTSGAPGALQEAPVDVSQISDKARNWSTEMRERAREEGASFDPSSQTEESRTGIRRDAGVRDTYEVSDAAKRATESGVNRAAALNDLQDELGSVGGQMSTVASQTR